MDKFSSVFARLSAYDESMLEHFVGTLRRILTTAQTRTIAAAQNGLAFEGGSLVRNKANSRFLRRLGVLFTNEAEQAGLSTMLEAYAETFDGSLTYMGDIVEIIRTAVKKPLPVLNLTQADLNLGEAIKANTVASIEGVVQSAAEMTARKLLFSVGGLKFEDLVGLLAKQLDVTVGQATTIATTSQSTFYRSISANQYQRMEEANGPMRYKYAGPRDKFNRPFCKHELDRTVSLARERIEKLDNGQLPNPFVSAGGFNCRHQWILDVEALASQFAEAA